MNAPYDHTSTRREVSCRTINTIIEFVRQKGKDVEALLDDLPFDEAFLTDTNNWISTDIADEITRRLKMMFDDDEILYKVALASEKLRTLGFLDYIARLMGDPNLIIQQAPLLNQYFNKTDELEVLHYGPSGATLKYFTKPGRAMTADDCYYTKGILAAMPNIFGIGPAKIWEETCSVPIHKKGRMNGKHYTVDEQKQVIEHGPSGTTRVVGNVASDGTFLFGKTRYGTPQCTYHVSWNPAKMFVQRILYVLFRRPKVLAETVQEMEKENDLIQKKYEELFEQNQVLRQHYVDTINAFIRAIDAKDHYTEDHSLKVSRVAEAIAREMKLPEDGIETLMTACKLHDVGKIGIKESILLKPGRLTDEEWQEIKKHPILGAQIIRPLTFLSDVAVLIRQDHERWDGAGYPDGLHGEQIEIGARIIMLADAYDAMTSGRPYRKAMTKEEAIAEILRNSGTQFDPSVVQVFMNVNRSL